MILPITKKSNTVDQKFSHFQLKIRDYVNTEFGKKAFATSLFVNPLTAKWKVTL
jgi:hypothetical protein